MAPKPPTLGTPRRSRGAPRKTPLADPLPVEGEGTAWGRVSLVGIDLLTIQARVVVASIETYLKASAALAHAGIASVPAGEVTADETAVSKNRPNGRKPAQDVGRDHYAEPAPAAVVVHDHGVGALHQNKLSWGSEFDSGSPE
jgi:hypothetical protein